MKYSLSTREIRRAEPEGFPSCSCSLVNLPVTALPATSWADTELLSNCTVSSSSSYQGLYWSKLIEVTREGCLGGWEAGWLGGWVAGGGCRQTSPRA